MSEQQTVVAVRLRYNPKIFWFDPALSTYAEGDHVLVDTERGREIGLVIDPAIEVTKKQIKGLKSPLKPVIRVLDENDFNRIDELDAKGREAMPVFRELVEKHGLDMKPVSVDFLFSGDKAVFYFSNEERVDFRELVRELASRFHTRVDMRQIGVRDEARILGGLAHCGEELCCARLGGEFQPVSIRMAKEQDLPLNPSKISGACGRLMCCLRYEFEAYKDFKSRAPKRGALIETPLGQAKVIDFNTPREIITMRLEDGKLLSIPLSEFDCPTGKEEGKRPCCVSREAIDRCASSSILMAMAALEQELTQDTAKNGEREPRRRREKGRDKTREQTRETTDEQPREQERPLRRPRRSGRGKSEAGAPEQRQTGKTGSWQGEQRPGVEREGRVEAGSRGEKTQRTRPRPGQHSSGLRRNERDRRGAGSADGASDTTGAASAASAGGAASAGDERAVRRERRERRAGNAVAGDPSSTHATNEVVRSENPGAEQPGARRQRRRRPRNRPSA
jgi:cell fate regulator YaaT (PSP1 superfamily)